MSLREFLFGKKRRCRFSTNLSEDECINRLRKLLIKDTIWIPSDYSSEIVGTIKESIFIIWKNSGRNSWKPQYRGKLREMSKGAMIDGYFDMYGFTKGLMIAWFSSGILMFSLSTTLFFLKIINTEDRDIPLWCLGMMIFGVIISRSGIWWGEKDQQSVIDFIKKTLQANQID